MGQDGAQFQGFLVSDYAAGVTTARGSELQLAWVVLDLGWVGWEHSSCTTTAVHMAGSWFHINCVPGLSAAMRFAN